ISDAAMCTSSAARRRCSGSTARTIVTPVCCSRRRTATGGAGAGTRQGPAPGAGCPPEPAAGRWVIDRALQRAGHEDAVRVGAVVRERLAVGEPEALVESPGRLVERPRPGLQAEPRVPHRSGLLDDVRQYGRGDPAAPAVRD